MADRVWAGGPSTSIALLSIKGYRVEGVNVRKAKATSAWWSSSREAKRRELVSWCNADEYSEWRWSFESLNAAMKFVVSKPRG